MPERFPRHSARELHVLLVARGWSLLRRGGTDHFLYAHPNGSRMSVSATPSDHRARTKALALARRLERAS